MQLLWQTLEFFLQCWSIHTPSPVSWGPGVEGPFGWFKQMLWLLSPGPQAKKRTGTHDSSYSSWGLMKTEQSGQLRIWPHPHQCRARVLISTLLWRYSSSYLVTVTLRTPSLALITVIFQKSYSPGFHFLFTLSPNSNCYLFFFTLPI